MAMKLSTGKVAFPIEFDNGDKDCIYFNPSDADLATRILEAKDKIASRLENLNFDDFELTTNGEAEGIESVEDFIDLETTKQDELLKKVEARVNISNKTKEILYEELNYAFGSDVSSVVFKHCSPLAIVNGEYFVLTFLKAIMPEITKAIKKANEDADKKMSKHLRKYAR